MIIVDIDNSIHYNRVYNKGINLDIFTLNGLFIQRDIDNNIPTSTSKIINYATGMWRFCPCSYSYLTFTNGMIRGYRFFLFLEDPVLLKKLNKYNGLVFKNGFVFKVVYVEGYDLEGLLYMLEIKINPNDNDKYERIFTNVLECIKSLNDKIRRSIKM